MSYGYRWYLVRIVVFWVFLSLGTSNLSEASLSYLANEERYGGSQLIRDVRFVRALVPTSTPVDAAAIQPRIFLPAIVKGSSNPAPIITPSRTPTSRWTATAQPTLASTSVASPTSTKTATPGPSRTSTATRTQIPSLTVTPSPNPTRTSTPTWTAAATFSASQTPNPSATRTLTPPSTFTPSPSPTRTSTPTWTGTSTIPSSPTSSPTAAATLTATQSIPRTGSGHFSLGPGGSDVIPHQIVRAADDRLYIFVYRGDQSRDLMVYRSLNAGFPTSAADFAASTVQQSAVIISVETVYDGARTIFVITNAMDGNLRIQPYDLASFSFRPAKLVAGGLITANTNVGTSGVSAGMAPDGKLHLAYWSGSSQIIHQEYTYNPDTDLLTALGSPTRLDTLGSANHPSLAVSPLDGSVTVAWVSEASVPARILARTRSGAAWGPVETLNTAPVWTSTNFGINIDQGPSLVIAANGTRYLTYIEDFRTSSPFNYGRVHLVVNSGSGWTDVYTGFYSHNPAMAIRANGEVYIIGHGFEFNQSPCTSESDMCFYRQSGPNVWTAELLAAHTATSNFDSSPSVKWSAVGWNRADVIEFIFPEIFGGDYSKSNIHYGWIGTR